MTDDVKPITIITTIHPPRKGHRTITVAAAPEGELPLMLTGDFAARHALADQAYGALLKRKPQVVKSANSSKRKVNKSKTVERRGYAKRKPVPVATAQDDSSAAVTEKADQLVPPGAPEALPVIEGDSDEGQLEMNLEADNG